MILSGIDTLLQTARLRKGKLARLSIAQIAKISVNLPDAQKNLDMMSLSQVRDIYNALQLCTTKTTMTASEYISTATCVVKLFDAVAPYEKYSGGDPEETKLMLQEIRDASKYESRDFERFTERVKLEMDRGQKVRRIKQTVRTALLILLVLLASQTVVHLQRDKIYNEGYESGYLSGKDSRIDAIVDATYADSRNESPVVYCARWSSNNLYHCEGCLLMITDEYKETTRASARAKGFKPCTYCTNEENEKAFEEGFAVGYESGLNSHG